jgi:hypothetical protein
VICLMDVEPRPRGWSHVCTAVPESFGEIGS